MANASPDLDRLSGRLVGFARISNAKGSEIESQRSMVEGLARKVGRPLLKWYEDFDRKRWQYNTSLVIAEMLADAENGLFDWIVIDKQQRVGTMGNEFFHFLTECERRNVRVWSVAEGDLSSHNILTSLNSVIAAESESKDQTNKAQNVGRGMRTNALAGRFNGSTLPYGYDRICLAVDGTERFRLVEDARHPNPGYVKGSKRPGEQRHLNHYLVIYPNGHEERRINPPGQGRHERYDFTVSVRADRVQTARDIYRMYADGFTRTAIAKHLNAIGVDLSFKSYWQATNITYVLTNPIYGGETAWRRSTSAIYSSVLPDGSYQAVDQDTQRRRRRSRATEATPDEGRIKGEKFREELRLIDPDTLDKVRARLADEGSKAGGSRRPRTDSFWMQPFLACGHCGGPMRGHPARQDGDYFLCARYSKSADLKVGGKGCVPNRVTLAELVGKLAVFLDSYGRNVEHDLEAAHHQRLEHMEIPRSEKGVLITRLRDEMESYVLDRMPVGDRHRLDAPGGWSLVEAYRMYFSRDEKAIEDQAAILEGKIDRMLDEAGDYPRESIARRKLHERIARIEEEVQALRASLTPLDVRIDAVQRQLVEINAAIRAVLGHTAARRAKLAGESLRKILSRIQIFSTPNPRAGGPNPARVTDRLVFHPRVGSPIGVEASPPKSGLVDGTLDRARELVAIMSVGAACRALNAEGFKSPRGKAWKGHILSRQLGIGFAAPPASSARGSQTLAPRNSRAKSGK